MPGELVQSLGRGLLILEAISRADDGLTLAQVADAMALKPPTAHNLLRTLTAHGFLAKTDGPTRYRLGPAVARIADQQAGRGTLRRVEAALRQLHRDHPALRLSFAEDVAGEVTTTLRIAPEQRGQVQRGNLQPMGPYASASALLHQALWPAETRAAYRSRYPFAEYAAHLWPSLTAVDAFLDEVRDRGFAEPRLPTDEHDFRVAAPVFGPGRRFLGALGAYLPNGRTDPAHPIDDARAALLAAAAGVTPEPHAPPAIA